MTERSKVGIIFEIKNKNKGLNLFELIIDLIPEKALIDKIDASGRV